MVGPGWTVTSHQLRFDGSVRDFLLARPAPSAAARLPVLVVLHGRRMAPADIARLSGFGRVVGHAILVYPAGLGGSWNAGACCGTAHALQANDVQFLSDVVGTVKATQPDASPGKAFLAGFSNGGRMAFQMACLRPDLFAAVAVVEAAPVAPCGSVTPVPMLVVASTGDPFLNLDGRRPRITIGSYVEPTVNQVLAAWRSRDGCAGLGRSTVVGQLTATTWSACANGASVALDLYVGNRHQWPPGTATTPSAQSEIWRFFQRAGAR